MQPGRSANPNGNNVGVKRPYQLMINNAAHNSSTDGSYPGRFKNVKLDKDVLLEDFSDENMVSLSTPVGRYSVLFLVMPRTCNFFSHALQLGD